MLTLESENIFLYNLAANNLYKEISNDPINTKIHTMFRCTLNTQEIVFQLTGFDEHINYCRYRLVVNRFGLR